MNHQKKLYKKNNNQYLFLFLFFFFPSIIYPNTNKSEFNQTILVTGGNGYIGSCTAYLLMQSGYNVIVLDKLLHKKELSYPWPIFIEADFADEKILHEIFSHYPITCVMHFAAFAEVETSIKKPRDYYENNVIKTLILLNSMLDHNIKNFIFSSSCSTYGNPIKLPIDETHPTNPINPYGKTKMMIELALEDYNKAYGLKYISLRYFNAAGAIPEANLREYHEPETHIIPILLNAIKNNKTFTIFGSDYNSPDGTCVRDFLHVKDIAQAHIQALQYLETNETSNIFNLGTGNGYSIKQMIQAAEKITGQQANLVTGQRRPGDPASLIANATKASTQLGWIPNNSDLENILTSAWNLDYQA